jgi:hypothetical protein
VNEPAARDDANEKWVRERSRGQTFRKDAVWLHTKSASSSQGDGSIKVCHGVTVAITRACSGVFRHMYVVVCIYQASMLPEQAENGLRGGTTSVRTGASFSRSTIENGQQRGCTATGLISSHHATIIRPEPLPNTSSKLNR